MKILLYGINYHPELTGVGKYTGEMAEWLASRGHNVKIITAPPYYPNWKIPLGYSTRWYKSEILKGVSVWRSPLWVPSYPTGWKRILHLTSFALSSMFLLFLHFIWRPQVIWVVAPSLFCAPGAWLIARLSGASSWLHIQDFEVDAAFQLGMLKGTLIRTIALGLESCLLKRFNRVSSISKKMVDLLIEKGVPSERVVLFPNWADLANINFDDVESNKIRKSLNISNDAVVALYSGNMGNKQGLEILAEVAKILLESNNIVFVFCGAGTGRVDLETLCLGLSNVRFLEFQPVESLGALLNMADIHLLPQRKDAADLVMPSKLTGMLASGRPVVATASTGTQVSMIVEGRGVVVPPENPVAFASAILELANSPEKREKLGRESRTYAEKFLDHNVVLSEFEMELKALVSQRFKGTSNARHHLFWTK